MTALVKRPRDTGIPLLRNQLLELHNQLGITELSSYTIKMLNVHILILIYVSIYRTIVNYS